MSLHQGNQGVLVWENGEDEGFPIMGDSFMLESQVNQDQLALKP